MTVSNTEAQVERRVVHVRLSETGLAAVDREAAFEDRSRSGMIRVLLAEAIRARAKGRQSHDG